MTDDRMTDGKESADGASHSNRAGIDPPDPRTRIEPPDPIGLVLLERRVLGVTVAVVAMSLMLMSITLRIRDLSDWVFMGYFIPLIFWPIYLVAMPEEERRLAIREGRHDCVTRNPWHCLRIKKARLQRTSPFRGRLFLMTVLTNVCISLALLTVATIELAKYLAG